MYRFTKSYNYYWKIINIEFGKHFIIIKILLIKGGDHHNHRSPCNAKRRRRYLIFPYILYHYIYYIPTKLHPHTVHYKTFERLLGMASSRRYCLFFHPIRKNPAPK
jgi:hypothetical protein